MTFDKLLNYILKCAAGHGGSTDFKTVSCDLRDDIFGMSRDDFLELIPRIGIIPEIIEHDSKEEKLFTKVTEMVLARCYEEIGLRAGEYTQRSGVADVLAKSLYHGYSLVSDAKSFRLSRTAKNQKDFKVASMGGWKKDNDYAVLCCPYFQYPQKKSAIYKQAIENNVLLFSWEHFYFLMRHNIKEDYNLNLSYIWNYSKTLANTTTIEESKMNFLGKQNKFISKVLNVNESYLSDVFYDAKEIILTRGEIEKYSLLTQIDEIKGYSRKKAVNALIGALKLNEKILTIDKYLDTVRGKVL